MKSAGIEKGQEHANGGKEGGLGEGEFVYTQGDSIIDHSRRY